MIASASLKTRSSVRSTRLGVVAYLLLTVVVVAVTFGDSLRVSLQNQVLFLGVLTFGVRRLSRTRSSQEPITFGATKRSTLLARSYKLWRAALLLAVALLLTADVVCTATHARLQSTVVVELFAVPAMFLFLITPDLMAMWSS